MAPVKSQVLAILLMASTNSALAGVRCLNGKLERVIEHKETGKSCQVTSNGKLLFKSASDKSFCLKKSHWYLKKLKTLGYTCVG